MNTNIYMYTSVGILVCLISAQLFLHKKRGSLKNRIQKLENNYPEPNSSSESPEVTPYSRIDTRLREIELETNKLEQKQNNFISSIKEQMNSREPGSTGGKPQKLPDKATLNRMLNEIDAERKARLRKNLNIENLLKDFKPESREEVKELLFREDEKENKVDRQVVDAVYSEYKKLQKKRVSLIRKALEHYKQTGEIETKAYSNTLKKEFETFKSRMKNKLSQPVYDQIFFKVQILFINWARETSGRLTVTVSTGHSNLHIYVSRTEVETSEEKPSTAGNDKENHEESRSN